MITYLAVGSACIACGLPIPRTLVSRDKGSPGKTGTIVCNRCGHIMHRDGDQLRNLTREEKKTLPQHSFAKEIRAEQESIVARYWG